jgi:hypothetical protein
MKKMNYSIAPMIPATLKAGGIRYQFDFNMEIDVLSCRSNLFLMNNRVDLMHSCIEPMKLDYWEMVRGLPDGEVQDTDC